MKRLLGLLLPVLILALSGFCEAATVGHLSIQPRVTVVGQNTTVTAQIWLPDSTVIPSSVILYEIGPDGKVLISVTKLAAGQNHIFTGSFVQNDVSPMIHHYQLAFALKSGGSVNSNCIGGALRGQQCSASNVVEVRSVAPVPVTNALSYGNNVGNIVASFNSASSVLQNWRASKSGATPPTSLVDFSAAALQATADVHSLAAFEQSTSAAAVTDALAVTTVNESLKISAQSSDSGTVLGFFGVLLDLVDVPINACLKVADSAQNEDEAWLADPFNPNDPAVSRIMAWFTGEQQFLGCSTGELVAGECDREVILSEYHDQQILSQFQSCTENAFIQQTVFAPAEDLLGDGLGVLGLEHSNLIVNLGATATGFVIDKFQTTGGQRGFVFSQVDNGGSISTAAGSHDVLIVAPGGFVRGFVLGAPTSPNSSTSISYQPGVVGVFQAPSVWPMSGHDAQRTGLSTFAAPLAVPSNAWSYTTGAPVIGDIAVSAEGNIYFSSDKLYSLSPTGALIASVNVVPLSTPAIDDQNGFVYVAISDVSIAGWDLVRYTKQLTNPTVFYFAKFLFGVLLPSSPIIGSDGAVYISDGMSIIAVGPRSWFTNLSPVCVGNPGLLAPAVGQNGAIYAMCQAGSGLFKVDVTSGTQLANSPYSRGGVEPVVDTTGNIHAGYQAFGGAIFTGSYDLWDANLNQLSINVGITDPLHFTTSRAAIMPDGTSTVRIAYSFQTTAILAATDAHQWTVEHDLPDPAFASPPAVDANGKVIVGTATGVQCYDGTTGAMLWTYDFGEVVTTQPAVTTGGSIVVGSKAGVVRSLNP